MSEKISLTYPIHETFYSFQGEGAHMGRAAYFIRLYGCPVHCPWCDSAGTWHPDWFPKHIPRLTAGELAEKASFERPAFVVITGGEPGIFDLTELISELHGRNLPVHVETSGAFPIAPEVDWLTVSPKWNKVPIAENLVRAHELKLIIEHPEDISLWEKEMERILSSSTLSLSNRTEHVWLHPEWSKSKSAAVLNAITDAVKQYPKLYRAGWQMHKLYAADELDSNSRPPVPLGGNPERGF